MGRIALDTYGDFLPEYIERRGTCVTCGTGRCYMKRLSILLFFLPLFLPGRVVFSVYKGGFLNTMGIGYGFGKICPYMSLEGAKYHYSWEYRYEETVEGTRVYTTGEKLTGDLFFVIPGIGIKWFMHTPEEMKSSFYFFLVGSKVFAFCSGKYVYHWAYYDSMGNVTGEYSDTTELEEEDKESIEEFLSPYLFKAGIGGEYFFSSSFSVGAEFGIQGFKGSSSYTYEYSWDNTTDTYESIFSYLFGLTFTRFSLNFRF
ncbi:hypothetical protein DRQ18_03255 [bacterium]|nr:MAG: hypothetical protein DRQ18_03255 [bacterium]